MSPPKLESDPASYAFLLISPPAVNSSALYKEGPSKMIEAANAGFWSVWRRTSLRRV